MRHITILVLISFFSTTCALSQLAGTLDTSFGNDGMSINTTVGSNQISVGSIDIQDDQKIVLVKSDELSNGWSSSALRYNSDGILDANYGSNGTSASYEFMELAYGGLQPSGDLIVTGHGYMICSETDALLYSRLSSLGVLDASFGFNCFEGPTSGALNGNMAVNDDGSFVIVGHGGNPLQTILALFQPNGMPVSSFGDEGMVALQILEGMIPYGVEFQADGKIVVVGFAFSAGWQIGITARFNLDGTLDTSFNGVGYFENDFDYWSRLVGVAIQDDEKIIVCGGLVGTTGFYQLLVMRYNSDGTLDTEFGANGYIVYENFVSSWGANLVVQADGKIVIVGNHFHPDDWSFEVLVIRYMPDGTLDSEFGDDGIFSTQFDDNPDFLYGEDIVIQNDQKLVIGASIEGGGISQSLVLRLHAGDVVDNTEKETIAPHILVFPNPCDGFVTVELFQAEIGNNSFIEISDQSGRIVHTEQMNGPKAKIDLGDLVEGLYLVNVTSKDSNFSRQLVIQ